MKCPRCEHANETGAKFCEECAAPLARVCAQCGRSLSATAKFCPECAHPTGLSAAARPARRFSSPETYTPKHLAERILTSRASLEGERKQVTVLFADLKGSMELLADRDPEEARKILDPVLERMIEAVHHYEGTVNQVMGDGIMALFGAPLAHEDDAVRACYAALRMQTEVRRYAEEIRRAEGLNVRIRVGINSGEVVVRAIGSDLHMDYTAVGQTSHLAARMEQLADPGSSLLTSATLALVEDYVQVRSQGPISVKGITEPVETFELTGGGSARTRFQAATARGLTRFVGRDPEMEQLRHAVERAATSHGQLVAVVGEAGVGKSRLFYEFTRSHRVQGWLILESGSVSYGKATAYLPVVDLLRGYFKIQDQDDQQEIRAKVIGRVLALDRSLEALLTPLLSLLDVPVEDQAWAALDPPQRRPRTLEALRRLLLRESQSQPLMLVFEDLHWIDDETQALLDSLVDSLGPTRILLLVNYRPEYDHRWARKSFYTQLRLESLPPESTGDLLVALLGDGPGLEPLKQMLRKRGNPLFLEESVRTLVETKALEGQRGAYRLVRPIHALQIPTTVQTMLAARIDRLPAEEKQLLQAASVIGKDVPYAILAAIAELPEETVRRALGHLQEGEFLYETSLFPELEYTFKHALTHDVAYASLLGERRRALHGLIAEVMERLYADRLAEHVERLAYHAFRGEAWDRALRYCRQAGDKAYACSANREAVVCFEQAIEALAHLPETRETLELAVDLRLDLRHALLGLAELTRVLQCLRDAEGLARRLADQRRVGRLSVYLAHSFLIACDPEARRFGRDALAIGELLEDFPLRIAAAIYLGGAEVGCGDFGSAVHHLRPAMQSLVGDLVFERLDMHVFPGPIIGFYLGWALGERGEFDEGIAVAQKALRIGKAVDHPYSLVAASCRLGWLYGIRGDFGQAIPVLERTVALARASSLVHLVEISMIFTGYVYALSGRVAEGLAVLLQAHASTESTGSMKYHLLSLLYLGVTCVAADRPDEALRYAGRAITLAQEREQRGDEAWALWLHGLIAAQGERPDARAAASRYHQSLSLATELGMRPLVAHCHADLAKLYRRTGRPTESDEHVTEAASMYRDLGMTYWLEQTMRARR